jgi:YebC/PmpR family DNA-binding regulatory protein
MAGHSAWKNLKHRKGAQDAKRGKVFTKLVKEITIAARNGGGDPAHNPRLRRALDTARVQNLPADNITRAIKKGTGELEGVAYEEVIYEGVGAGGSFFIIEITTDNRNRTAGEIRKILDKHHGHLGATHSATWAFDQKGQIRIDGKASSEEQLFEVAVGAGADDIEQVDGQWLVSTSRNSFDAVRDAVEKAKIPYVEAGLVYVPKTPKEVDVDLAKSLLALYDALDEHDDVQNVFADFELSDSAAKALSAS